MAEVAKVGEIDVAIKPVAKADILLIAQAFDVKKADGTLFKAADTLTGLNWPYLWGGCRSRFRR